MSLLCDSCSCPCCIVLHVGFDIDFCKAVAAAMFDGKSDSSVIDYVEVNETNWRLMLATKDIDILARTTPISLSDDVTRSSREKDVNNWGIGLTFTQPIYYDGLTFGGIPP